jgi:hypothetical protein
MVLQRKIPNARHRRGALRRDHDSSKICGVGEFKLPLTWSRPVPPRSGHDRDRRFAVHRDRDRPRWT